MLVGTRPKIEKSTCNIKINGTLIKSTCNTKLLGLHIDHCLKWDKQVEHIIKTVSPKLGLLQRLSRAQYIAL